MAVLFSEYKISKRSEHKPFNIFNNPKEIMILLFILIVYPTLQGYYDELLKLCTEKPDVKKQKMMKNLCLLEYQMQVNIQAGKDIGALSNSYKAMFEAAELKVENADTSNDSFGKWIMDIENRMLSNQLFFHNLFC